MNRLSAAAMAVVFVLAASAAAFASGDFEGIAGSGSIQGQDRAVPAFQAVVVEGSGTLTVRQGPPGPVHVETDDNLLPLVRTEVVGGVLHLGFVPDAHVMHVTRLEFTVSAPTVTALTVAGSGTIQAASPLRGDSLALDIRGSGTIACDAQVSSLELGIGGSGRIQTGGTADHIVVTIEGSGTVKARGLASTTAEVKISGSGDAVVFVTRALDVSINGSGNVRYGGGARTTVHSSGSGSVGAY